MKFIGNTEIQSLINVEEWPAVSIYIPVSRVGDQQDSIRYKNNLNRVQKRLISDGMKKADAHRLLAAEYELVKDDDFWMNLGQDGLAVFITRQTVPRYPLPVSFREFCMVGKHLHVTPLLPLLARNPYMVLALSKNSVQLFQGDRFQIEEITLPEVAPKSMAEALAFDDPEKQIQFHTKTAAAGGKREAMFHGQGAGADEQDNHLQRYVQAIDNALFPPLDDKEIPIVLAGTEKLSAHYQQVTRSRNILSESISGNVADFASETLQEKAWNIVGEYYAKQYEDLVESVKDELGSGNFVDGLEQVITAAYDGRVDTLFVAENEHVWGKFYPESREVKVLSAEDTDVVNLLDTAVMFTLNANGNVYVQNRQKLPTDAAIAAHLRY